MLEGVMFTPCQFVYTAGNCGAVRTMQRLVASLWREDMVPSLAFKHNTVVQGLSRACIVAVQPGEPFNFRCRHRGWMLKHKPCHVLAAGRCGQRPGKFVVAPIRGQYPGCVDLDVLQSPFLLF